MALPPSSAMPVDPSQSPGYADAGYASSSDDGVPPPPPSQQQDRFDPRPATYSSDEGQGTAPPAVQAGQYQQSNQQGAPISTEVKAR